MKNRMAWGLVVVLGAAVLGGIGLLATSHVRLLPRQEWGFGREITVIRGITRDFRSEVTRLDRFKLGLIAIRW
jgi:hypothetical protein